MITRPEGVCRVWRGEEVQGETIRTATAWVRVVPRREAGAPQSAWKTRSRLDVVALLDGCGENRGASEAWLWSDVGGCGWRLMRPREVLTLGPRAQRRETSVSAAGVPLWGEVAWSAQCAAGGGVRALGALTPDSMDRMTERLDKRAGPLDQSDRRVSKVEDGQTKLATSQVKLNKELNSLRLKVQKTRRQFIVGKKQLKNLHQEYRVLNPAKLRVEVDGSPIFFIDYKKLDQFVKRRAAGEGSSSAYDADS
ncbi:hypothetical protein NDU88_008758 [Pleurodeles waltl]|uniref:Uncharacterized protein n=1 Tax=Pleurodeles waltl TaxID=8319 RepID=A0AAV7PTU6_PLEWA|nr:hypothetical protein NDU88_008758 [Pleurodeles waltl]